MDDTPVRILVVDDDQDDFVLAKAYLRQVGKKPYQVEWAETLAMGEKLLLSVPPYDAALIDYRVKGDSGLDLVRWAVQRGLRIPLIVLTGQGDYDVDMEAMQAGADDYLIKSEITPSLLERTIRYAIERRKDRRERERLFYELKASEIHMEVQQHLIEHREIERSLAARTLYDGPVQDLISLLFSMECLAPHCETHEAKRVFDDIRSRTKALVSDLRDVCDELRPPGLARFGLPDAIQAHAQNCSQKHHLCVRVFAHPPDLDVPEAVRLALYRIYQEAMNNVLDYSGANQVQVRLMAEDQQVVIEIEDNGRGFVLPDDWLQLARAGHFGLVSMKERAEAVNGTLTVQTSPCTGTVVRVTVPIEHKKAGLRQKHTANQPL